MRDRRKWEQLIRLDQRLQRLKAKHPLFFNLLAFLLALVLALLFLLFVLLLERAHV